MEFYIVHSFGASSFYLTFYIWFHELGKRATSPSLKGVALCGSVSSIGCVFQEALAGWMELEQPWAMGVLGCTVPEPP